MLDYPEHEEAVVENICVAVSDDKVTAVDNKIPEKQTEFQKNIQSKIDELRRILDRVRE